MIRDVLDILRSSREWLDPDEVVNQLKDRDPVRYRNATRDYVNQRLRKLASQGYPIETERTWNRAVGVWQIVKVRMKEESQ